MVVGRGEIWAVGRVFQHLKTQLVNGFNSMGGRVWAALSCNNKTFFDYRLLRLVRIAGFSLLASIALYLALLIVHPFSR